MSKMEVRVLCHGCGLTFYAVADSPNILQQCPRCYNKSMEDSKCYYCAEEAKYTQPGQTTGKIIDVCEKHFIYRNWG